MKIIQKFEDNQMKRYLKKSANKRILVIACAWAICASGVSQSNSNHEDGNDYERADAHLNEVYRQILEDYKEDAVFISRLTEAQRIWILYRDAELEIKFPEENKAAEYGSVYPDCAVGYLAELTLERTRKLQTWLSGVEEGDVCSGSLKIKDN